MKENISKRIIGAVAIGVGIGMQITSYILAVKFEIKDPGTAQAVANSLIILGGGLLGLDTFKPKDK